MKAVAVTAGAGALGLRTARALAVEPAVRLVLTGRRLQQTERLAEDIDQEPGRRAATLLP